MVYNVTLVCADGYRLWLGYCSAAQLCELLDKAGKERVVDWWLEVKTRKAW